MDELINYLRNKSGEHEMSITSETLIEGDLGFTGEDAYQLIIELSKQYKIDISDFDFRKYFNDEPGVFSPDRIVKPFTVGHLMNAINAKRLDEDVIQG